MSNYGLNIEHNNHINDGFGMTTKTGNHIEQLNE